MQEMQMFESPEFGRVRTLVENGEILFCGSDVAKALGYARPNEAIARHSRGTLKRRIPTNSGEQEMLFIPEPDLYRLIFGSKLPTAEKFTDWVTKEILPSIRKGGVYMTDEALEAAVDKVFDLRPTAIINRLDLRKPLYRQTAAYGHFGRPELDLPWEKTDAVEAIKAVY